MIEEETFSFRKESVEAKYQLVVATKQILDLIDDSRGRDPGDNKRLKVRTKK
jgi:hypothetical protein